MKLDVVVVVAYICCSCWLLLFLGLGFVCLCCIYLLFFTDVVYACCRCLPRLLMIVVT